MAEEFVTLVSLDDGDDTVVTLFTKVNPEIELPSGLIF